MHASRKLPLDFLLVINSNRDPRRALSRHSTVEKRPFAQCINVRLTRSQLNSSTENDVLLVQFSRAMHGCETDTTERHADEFLAAINDLPRRIYSRSGWPKHKNLILRAVQCFFNTSEPLKSCANAR